jgi:serine protease Do
MSEGRAMVSFSRGTGSVLLIVSLLIGLITGTGRAADLSAVIDKVRPAVVAVGTVQQTRRPPALFRATGFAVADGLYILTNAHVLPEVLDVKQQEYLAVFTGRGQHFEARRATPAAVDGEHDLVLLKIDGSPLPALSLDWSRQVREGEEIAFTGFPIGIVLGLYPVTHRGMVSALTPIAIPLSSAGQLNSTLIKRLRDPFEVIQLDATAYPGNSGSPLYDSGTGRVFGVVNSGFVKESKEAVLKQPSGITYAIPIGYAKALFEKVGMTPR